MVGVKLANFLKPPLGDVSDFEVTTRTVRATKGDTLADTKTAEVQAIKTIAKLETVYDERLLKLYIELHVRL